MADRTDKHTGGHTVQPQRTVGQYRAIDLSLFALMLIIFETVLIRAAAGWFPDEPWTVSVTAAITALVMVRWGPWAVIHAVIGGIVFCTVNRGQAQQFLIYCVGNTASLTVLPLFRKIGWQKLREDFLLKLLCSVLTVLAMQAGRAVPALMLGVSPAGVWRMAAMDSITCLFTAVIVWITSRLDGMLEDQAHYLKRLSHEPEP